MKDGPVGLLIIIRIGNPPGFISAGRKPSPGFSMAKN